ncbi:MAG: aminodeoxychorismate synthase, component I [Candidatus Geothermincolia bacterium]
MMSRCASAGACELALRVEPLPRDADLEDLCGRVAGRPYTAWLDSSLTIPRLGRYSFLAFDPCSVIESRGRDCRLARRDGRTEARAANPFAFLRETLDSYTMKTPAGLPPFLGGGVGFLAYELGRHIERLPASAVDDLGLPEMAFAFYDRVVAHDHASGETWLVVTGEEGVDLEERLHEAMNALRARPPVYAAPAAPSGEGLRSGFTREAYLESVKRVKEYIRAGDIYQANLSQRFTASLAQHPWTVYRKLRRLNAAPFSAYLNFGEVAICSSSPERFVKLSGDRVETRPIKGTRPRSADEAEDAALRRELTGSVKDRAELSMIVDLERNDLGRVCSYGSVEVEEHAVIESYATVHHLVSTVAGKLHPGRDIVDLLRASFPGGSITGAPKIRSMEIIDELEPTARSVYTGCIGYIGWDGAADLNIAIRTILATHGSAHFQVGGGIVADSDPADEYQETLDKGAAIFRTLARDEL